MIFIGEIGINHNGDFSKALELIQKAKESGVSIVKFQKRDPDLCIPEHQKNTKRVWKGKETTYLEYKRDLEFSEAEYDIINKYCKFLQIQWTASVWDTNSVEFMKRYTEDIPFIKIPSACITDMELLKAVNDWGIPVAISDGMSTQEEVEAAINALDNLKIILHCNSSYPCKETELDLNMIKVYKEKYYDKEIGYSGHETDLLPTLVAVALGAETIERHITLDKNMEGTDHKASLDISEMTELIKQANRIPFILGDYELKVYDSELKVRDKLRNTGVIRVI